jgi:hypothetical protein
LGSISRVQSLTDEDSFEVAAAQMRQNKDLLSLSKVIYLKIISMYILQIFLQTIDVYFTTITIIYCC